MSISRRYFLRDGAQTMAAASLLGTAALTGCASTDSATRAGAQGDKAQAGNGAVRSVSARDLKVLDVAGLALIQGAGCNVVALGSPDGALMIDGGLAANSAMLLSALHGAVKTSKVNTLINTHWHPEQTGSNEAVGMAGGTIIAHEVTKLALGAALGNRSAVYEGTFGPLPKAALPAVTTYNKGSLQIAGEEVQYRYLPGAHTNGDLFVHFPKRNVIVVGGPVGSDRWPVIDYMNGGFMHGFMRSYEILTEIVEPDTIIIPTNGPTLTGADVVRHKDIYTDLFKQFFVLFNKGFGPKDVAAYNAGVEFMGVGQVVVDRPLKREPGQSLAAQLGDPAQFLEYAYRSTQLATLPH
ncbi:MAG TPA: MBL fold metallo-hydrolase [Steroidobacteraceae bacterium]|nr:MBL fold metallo-hydrolase [Steroidobacteraceae bacterium]